MSDSPLSSAPSTPNDDGSHKRNESLTIGNEDYFMTALRLRQDTKSAPGTPSGQGKRNATFSPRIVFYDTWPSGEYDRRSELATCNRLTPMLAQQIKEELNNFKMVSSRCAFDIDIGGWLTWLNRKWKFTRAPRSTLISSDNDSVRWSVYPLSTRASGHPNPCRVFTYLLDGRSGIAS